jgi:hypothetical protein
MKNAIFWDVVPCDFIINRCIHLQDRRNNASKEKCQTLTDRLTTVRSTKSNNYILEGGGEGGG